MTEHCKPENEELRKALDAPDGFPVSRHREYIESVRSVYPHTVVFREAMNESTCVLYALGLLRDPTYRAIASNFEGKIFAGRAFMEWSIKGRVAEIDKPTEGCLVLYFNNGIWQHVGILSKPGRVTSQWGTFPVYEHDLCDLPARYGDEVRYFTMLGQGEPLRLFREFAKTQGVSDTDIAICAGELEIYLDRPSSFSAPEIDDFLAFVLAGGEVTRRGLRERVRNASHIAFARQKKCLIGVAGLKHPADSYRRAVEGSAGFTLPAETFPYELGWIFVLPSARRRGLSTTLCRSLVGCAERRGIFATSRDPFMQRALERAGFRRVGREWYSKKNRARLALFVNGLGTIAAGVGRTEPIPAANPNGLPSIDTVEKPRGSKLP